ncbi:MAG: hypothetical protein ABI435_07905 [Pseudolysinimonas sp.]
MATAAPRRSERVVLAVLSIGAAVLGLVSLIAGILRLRLYLVNATDGATPLELLTDAPLDGIPSAGEPSIVVGGYSSAHLLVRGLTTGTRALLASGELISIVVAVVVSAAIAVLLLFLARGRAFARPLVAVAQISGATLAVGSLLGQGLTGLGMMSAADELNPLHHDLFTVGFVFDPAPIFIGLVIMGLAFVFRSGSRLQRETEGLV